MILKAMFSLLITLSWIYGSDIGYLSSYLITNDSIQFQISIKDTLYTSGDTINVTYMIKNNSYTPIYIFDPNAYILNPYFLNTPEKNGCLYKIELGGNWYPMLGYEQILSLQWLAAKSQKKYILKFILTNEKTGNSCYDDEYEWSETLYKYQGIYLNIGYINSNFDLIKRKGDMFDLNISSNQIGNLIMDKLNRLKLGPIFYKKGY